MPKAAERALRAQANTHKDWSKERRDAYVYGAMRHKLGWKPEDEKSSSSGSKGKRYTSRGRS